MGIFPYFPYIDNMPNPQVVNAFQTVKPKSTKIGRNTIGLKPGQVLDMAGKPMQINRKRINVVITPAMSEDERVTQDLEFDRMRRCGAFKSTFVYRR